jgi:hypothetical protein
VDPDREREQGDRAAPGDRSGDQVGPLVPLHEPVEDVADRLDGLERADRQEDRPRLPAIVDEGGDGRDPEEADRGGDEPQREVVARRVLGPRVRRQDLAERQVREEKDRRRNREPKRELAQHLPAPELREHDEHAPLAAGVGEAAHHAPRCDAPE